MLELVLATAMRAAGVMYFPHCDRWTPRVTRVLRFQTIFRERSAALRELEQRLLCERCRPSPSPQTCVHPALCVLSIPPKPHC